MRYSGRATEEVREEHARAPADWIASEDLEPVAAPRWAGYDAPWTLPPLRRNEVLVDVAG